MNRTKSVCAPPPYQIIVNATNGDPEAIDEILRHYGHYINKLATRTFYTQEGKPDSRVDDEMKLLLEAKLISKILEFKIDPAA